MCEWYTGLSNDDDDDDADVYVSLSNIQVCLYHPHSNSVVSCF